MVRPPDELPACPRCGYRRGRELPMQAPPSAGDRRPGPGYACPVCSDGDPDAPTAKPPARGVGALVAGALALPSGLGLFTRDPRLKRYLIPPLAITTVVFTVLILWARAALAGFLDRSLAREGEDVALTSLDPGWWRSSLEWFLNDAWGLELLRGSSWVLFVVLAWVLAWYCFSIVYELVAGPFLDEVHGLVEERWFGVDPRKDVDRPVDLPVETCARRSWLLGAIGAGLFAAGFLLLDWPWALLAFLLFAAPFLVAAVRGDDYGRWLRWVARVEGRSALTGLEMGLVSLVFVVGFVWLNLVPGIGQLAYSGAVGLGTAIGMLDLPLERRGWTLAERVAFLGRHPAPIMAFGLVTGMAFAVPIIGPVLAVPSASLGALWLLCRLDTGTAR